MKLEDFPTETYVRRPFQVKAFEITPDNIAELAPHVGELCDDNGTPFIKSDKKKVGNNFKVWPGFFATVLKGSVRCYSRKTFFDQFGELNDRTSPAVEFLHGRCTVEELINELTPSDSVGEPDQEEAAEPQEIENVYEEPAEAAEAAPEPVSEPVDDDTPKCEHGVPEGEECVYKTCDGVETEDNDDDTEIEDDPASQDGLLGGAGMNDVPEPQEGNDALERYRAGLESVIKP